MEKQDDFAFLSAPAQRALAGEGIKALEDLRGFTREDLLDLHGFGPKGLRMLEEKMVEAKVKFKMK